MHIEISFFARVALSSHCARGVDFGAEAHVNLSDEDLPSNRASEPGLPKVFSYGVYGLN